MAVLSKKRVATRIVAFVVFLLVTVYLTDLKENIRHGNSNINVVSFLL
jgi:uncharacterized membrane protein YjfL (UPF0719 family)